MEQKNRKKKKKRKRERSETEKMRREMANKAVTQFIDELQNKGAKFLELIKRCYSR